MERVAIGLDIGGTKVAAGVIASSGEVLERSEVKSDTANAEKMFAQVLKAVDGVLEKASIGIDKIEGIGVGVPGKVDRENGIAVFQNNLPWEQFPVTARLSEVYGTRNMTIDNDVYMAAYAEWKASKVDPSETFVYITISTGISCSIIHKGEFFRGAGFAGEIGLMPVLSKLVGNKNERLEKLSSGPAIQSLAASTLNFDGATAAGIFQGYLAGEHQYQPIINDMTETLAQAVYAINCLLDPHSIVFGGSVITHNPFLLNLVKKNLARHLIPEQRHILGQMSISRLGSNNGIVGAGMRVFEHLGVR